MLYVFLNLFSPYFVEIGFLTEPDDHSRDTSVCAVFTHLPALVIDACTNN